MRLATLNVNSLRVRLPHLTDWLAANPVDVIALQETKLPDADFPRAPLASLGLEVVFSGQRTYNGVALLAKAALEDVVTGIPGFEDEQRRVIAATVGGVRVINVYVPNGQSVGLRQVRVQAALVRGVAGVRHDRTRAQPERRDPGGLQRRTEDRDVHDPKAWEGSVLVSEPERAALRALMATGFEDCFRRFEQPEKTFSWWDYRMMAFRRNAGLRIDLVLASSALAQKCDACHIDKAPRRLERPSDHAPVLARFDI
jgi:exodeoxyribonuclease III